MDPVRLIPKSRIAEVIGRLVANPDSAFSFNPPPGTLRGIDFYPFRALLRSMARALHQYKETTGEAMSVPEKAMILAEKIFWSKFFRPMLLPSPANKLTAYSLLPQKARQRLKQPPKVWQSSQLPLPSNDAVPAGSYYLKTNNGSTLNAKVSADLLRRVLPESFLKQGHCLRKEYTPSLLSRFV
jgi:hypothetical protein